MRVGDLEVVPEHPVEAHLERRDAGALALALLQRRRCTACRRRAARAARRARRRSPRRMTPPSASVAGGRSVERAGQHVGQVAQQVELVERGRRARLLLGSAARVRVSASSTSGRRRKESRSAPSSRGVARPAAARPASRSSRARRPAPRAAARGRGRRRRQASTASSRASIARRVARAGDSSHCAQQPGAHRRHGAVDRLEQRDAAGAGHGAARPARGCGASSRRARGAPSLRRTAGRARCGSRRAGARRGSAAARRRRRGGPSSSVPRPSPSSEASVKRRASSSRASAGIELPALPRRCAVTPSVEVRASASGGHHHFRRRRSAQRVGESIGGHASRARIRRWRDRSREPTPAAPLPATTADRHDSCCARPRASRPAASRPASPSRPLRGARCPWPASGPPPARRWRRDAPRRPAAAGTRRPPSPARRRAARRRPAR